MWALVFRLELRMLILDRKQNILRIEAIDWLHRWLQLIHCLRTRNFGGGDYNAPIFFVNTLEKSITPENPMVHSGGLY